MYMSQSPRVKKIIVWHRPWLRKMISTNVGISSSKFDSRGPKMVDLVYWSSVRFNLGFHNGANEFAFSCLVNNEQTRCLRDASKKDSERCKFMVYRISVNSFLPWIVSTLEKFSLHKRKLNVEIVWDFQVFKNLKRIVSVETICGNLKWLPMFLINQLKYYLQSWFEKKISIL